jgi:hypothetical protein
MARSGVKSREYGFLNVNTALALALIVAVSVLLAIIGKEMSAVGRVSS